MSDVNYYFAGGNTTRGFVSYFKYIIEPAKAEQIYCIKGGPGVGKSTFMKKCGKSFENMGFDVSYFHCPSDPASLDGVLIDELKLVFLDGTAPHIVDPVYPGAVDCILDFGNFFDSSLLKQNRQEIIELSDRVGEWFERAKSGLKPAGTLYENVRGVYKKNENEKKINLIYKDLSEKIFKGKCSNGGKERKLFLSAITPDGVVNFANETLKNKKLFVLNSFCGDASADIMSLLKNEAKERGFDAECFYCTLSPYLKTDHIVIPELDVAVSVSNSYHINELEGREYDISECYPGGVDKLKVSKIMMAADEIISGCTENLNRARALHSELEKYYIEAMNYDELNLYTDKIAENIKI